MFWKHWKQLFGTKSLEHLKAEAEGANRLRRILGPYALTSLGVGAIIGSGIFVMTGRVAFQDAGPAIMLSFVVAGIGCLFAALCYSEFASMAPVAGSAYTYAYATLGELLAWIIGWDLVLEYAMACACVAAAWSQYFNELTTVLFGWRVPDYLCNDPFSKTGAWLNLPAMLITLAVTAVLVVGIKESARTNATLVGVKVGVVLFVILTGCFFIKPSNWTSVPVSERVFPADEIIPSIAEKDVKEGTLTAKEADALIATTARDIQAALGKAKTSDEQVKVIEKRLRAFYQDTAKLPEAERDARIKTLTANLQAWAKVERKKDELAADVAAGKLTQAEADKALAKEKERWKTSRVERRKAAVDKQLKAGAITEARAKAILKVTEEEPFATAYLPRNPEDEAITRRLFEKVEEEAEKKVTEKWGILGLMGLNRWLVPIDDSVRSPFAPYGLAGIIFGASIVFFAYIGFDAISTHSEEARNPERDVPIGILASLVLCTLLYILMAGVLTGMMPYSKINPEAAVANAFTVKGLETNSRVLLGASALISIGALAGMTSVLLISFLSQARIFLAMARDELLPPAIFGAIHPRFRTPHISTMLTGGIISVVAAFTPIRKLEEMVNIGTLMAFIIVCASVLILRIQRPTLFKLTEESLQDLRAPQFRLTENALKSIPGGLRPDVETKLKILTEKVEPEIETLFREELKKILTAEELSSFQQTILQASRTEGFPEPLLEKLTKVKEQMRDKPPVPKKEFLDELRQVLSPEEMKQYEGALVDRIGSPRRPFQCPALFVVAPLGILVNFLMMLFLPLDTWLRLLVWLFLGLLIYFFYGMKHSTLRKETRGEISGLVDGHLPTAADNAAVEAKMASEGIRPPGTDIHGKSCALMRITRFDSQLLHVPLSRPRASPAEAAAGRLNHIVALLVQLDTDAGVQGLGFAYALQGSGRALHAIAVDDLAPLVVGEDPLDHERLGAKVYWRLQTVGRRGLVQQAYSAIDLALWDIKGKVANLPLYKLLGGARESAPVYGSDTAWLWMSVEEILEASQPYLDHGMMGIKVKVGGAESDADRLGRLREALGEDVWLAVDANERYDYPTALAMGHYFEEEIGVEWFEEPLLCEDVAGHARLASKLEVSIAGGEMLFGLDEFRSYLERDALAVVQPDVTRVGGLTNWLKVAALAAQYHRPLSPHLLPEVGVHLACGLPEVTSVEYMPWLYPLFTAPPRLEEGRLVPPNKPGLGLELDADMVAKYRVAL